MTNVGGTTQGQDKHLHKYGSDILIISGSYGGHRRQTTDHPLTLLFAVQWF